MEDENDIEALQKLPDDEIIDDKEDNETVFKCRKGFAKLLVISPENMIVFRLDYIIKKTPDVQKIKDYLLEKYKGHTIREIR